MLQRPSKDEYGPNFATYIEAVPDGELIAILEQQLEEAVRQLRAIPEEAGALRYAPGKWSVREVVGHIGDTERIMSYRLLRVARGDRTPLPGFDENAFVAGADFDAAALDSLVAEFIRIRESTLALVRGIPPQAWQRVGDVSGFPVSARALAYVIAGHERHHRGVIAERYIKG